jgi:hypothetical protein
MAFVHRIRPNETLDEFRYRIRPNETLDEFRYSN